MMKINSTAISAEKMVFAKNRELERCKLLMERRPSWTTTGMEAKLESSSTRLETVRAASLPEAMAMEQSASFRASTSLTPSPVMATVCPWAFRALTKLSFCWGVTRPKTEYSFTARRISSSVRRVVASTYLSACSRPAFRAMLATVTALSPEMTFKSTPWSAKYRKVRGASRRILSLMSTSPSSRSWPGSAWPSKSSWLWASSRTRCPCWE